MAQPLRAAVALAAHLRGADPPLGVVRSHDQRERLGDVRAGASGSSSSSSPGPASSGPSPSSAAGDDAGGDVPVVLGSPSSVTNLSPLCARIQRCSEWELGGAHHSCKGNIYFMSRRSRYEISTVLVQILAIYMYSS